MLGEILDEERLVVDDVLDRLLEQLREARHVHALLRRVEIDGAVDRRRDQLLAAAVADPDGLLDARDAGAARGRAPPRGLTPGDRGPRSVPSG